MNTDWQTIPKSFEYLGYRPRGTGWRRASGGFWGICPHFFVREGYKPIWAAGHHKRIQAAIHLEDTNRHITTAPQPYNTNHPALTPCITAPKLPSHKGCILLKEMLKCRLLNDVKCVI